MEHAHRLGHTAVQPDVLHPHLPVRLLRHGSGAEDRGFHPRMADHLRDGFIVRQIANNTVHIRISGKLAGLLAAVAGHDLIAAILTGTDDSGLGHAPRQL